MDAGPVGLGLETSFFFTTAGGGRGTGAGAGAGVGTAAAGSGEEEVVGAVRSLVPRKEDDFFLNMLTKAER